jgi:hypothetical protein
VLNETFYSTSCTGIPNVLDSSCFTRPSHFETPEHIDYHQLVMGDLEGFGMIVPAAIPGSKAPNPRLDVLCKDSAALSSHGPGLYQKCIGAGYLPPLADPSSGIIVAPVGGQPVINPTTGQPYTVAPGGQFTPIPAGAAAPASAPAPGFLSTLGAWVQGNLLLVGLVIGGYVLITSMGGRRR